VKQVLYNSEVKKFESSGMDMATISNTVPGGATSKLLRNILKHIRRSSVGIVTRLQAI
jgi:hypothetical protein